MSRLVWVHGIGDRLLARVADWAARWPSGKEAGTRPFLRHDGIVEDVVTLRSVPVDWDPKELDYLLRVLEARRPHWYMTEEFRRLRQRIHLAPLRPGGLRRVDMVSYADEPQQILAELVAVRDGLPTKDDLAGQIANGSFWEASGEGNR